MGESAERSHSPALTIEEFVLQLTQRSTTIVEPQALVVESRTEPAVTAAAEEPAATQAEEEAPTDRACRHRQHTWHSDRDCCPVKLVSEDLSRVVHVGW
jgi:hypothetical protein